MERAQPDELSPALRTVQQELTSKFGKSLLETSSFRGELAFVVAPENWIPVLTYCKESETLGFDRLDCLFGNHYPERVDRPFEVVANLTSIPNTTRLRIKTRVAEGGSLPTATGLWPSAGFDERETWEMFGVVFDGHPNLQHLLLVSDFEGFPLRKDFPLKGLVGGRIRTDLKGKL